ncbi:hypothetical protein KAI92_03710 [Candidatus Parcubacteria bacterium]|nr:hypothetical protein [Candidatus Parcubacteria bacterium]
MNKVRFLPLLIPIIIGFLFELFYWKPKLIYYILILIVFLFYYTIRKFLKFSKVKESLIGLLVLPVYFTIGLVVFSTMVSNKVLVQFLFFINIVFLYFYFLSIYNYLLNVDKYKKGSLENFSSHGNFLSIFFIASSVYGLQSLVGISIVKLFFVLLLALLSIVYQVVWANKIDKRIGGMYILIACLVMIELAWALSFLTLSFYVLGLILAIYYYTLIGLVRFYLLGDFRKQIVKLYLIFGLSSIIVVLLTSRWI